MGYIPSQKYVSGEEIRSYLGALVRKYGIEKAISFRTHVDSVRWSPSARSWTAEMTVERGAFRKERQRMSIMSNFVLLATGLFSRPNVPQLPGISGKQPLKVIIDP